MAILCVWAVYASASPDMAAPDLVLPRAATSVHILSFCPDMIMKVIFGFPFCPDVTTEIVPKFHVCNDTTMEVVFEFPFCPDATTEVVHELPVCPGMTTGVNLEHPADPVMTMEHALELSVMTQPLRPTLTSLCSLLQFCLISSGGL